jgi:hypothetical protein
MNVVTIDQFKHWYMKTFVNSAPASGYLPSLLSVSLLVILTVSCTSSVAQTAKDIESFESNSDNNRYLPLFFAKEPPVGSAYFMRYWMKGAAEFIDHKTIPTRDKMVYFNFDKRKNILLVAEGNDKIKYYHSDSVTRFILLDSLSKTYVFKIVPAISESFFLQPLIESNNGYSLYKKIITKVTMPDYQNYGYGATGVKHDTYTDYDEYYLLFADKLNFRKFFLNENSFKKVFKPWSTQTASFANDKGNINEISLIQLVELINNEHK